MIAWNKNNLYIDVIKVVGSYMSYDKKSLKIEAENLSDEILDLEDDRSSIVIDDYKDTELETLKSTRDNFLIWKDFEY
ncbi:MAG: hypothetical protein KDK56_10270 [Simkania sp.]|nr:hypothetical protein [Simkania sp.]